MLDGNLEVVKKVFSGLHHVFNKSAFGTHPKTDIVNIRSKYAFLSDDEFNALPYKGDLCQGAVLKFMQLMKVSGIPAYYLFAYCQPIIRKTIDNFNTKYLKYVLDENHIGATDFIYSFTSTCDIESTHRFTHALVEIAIGNFRYVVDPYCGLFYPYGKEELIRYPDKVYEAYHWHDQVSWIANSIQRGRDQLIYASTVFWRGIYHISYNQQGGLPVFPEKNNA